jgi:two-component system, OmpR family, sensor histidine kinase KdpD
MAFSMTGSKRPLTSAGQRQAAPPLRHRAWHRDASRRPPWRGGFPAPYALPAGFAALLAVGTVTAACGGRLGADGVLIACAVVVGVLAAAAEPVAAIPLGIIGWLTVSGFSRPPYADLRLTGFVAERAAITLALVAGCAAVAGATFRWLAARGTLESVDRQEHSGLSPRRQLAGAVLALAGLPSLTALLYAVQRNLNLSDDLLIYLVAVVAVTVVGGFWPAVFASIAACLLLNWFFTAPLHTFTIAEPRNLLALVLFVTVAVAVSSVVHLAARREADASRSAKETESLLGLAQTVLGGADTPGDVLDHLTASHGGRADLLERVSGRWIMVAESGCVPDGKTRHHIGHTTRQYLPGGRPPVPPDVGRGALHEQDAHAERPKVPGTLRFEVRPDLALEVSGQAASATTSLLAGYTAQAVAALDRARLRTQAAQAEALAEGDRMRTALLRAVSHDLRTPLASIKASVSSLRQTDVHWSAQDEAELLANVEQNADRLDALVGNLLDMSRLQAGSIEPFLRATAVDEVAPVALRGLDDADQLLIIVPDDLPLVRADPGLLERVLANLFSNALRHSPPDQRPLLRAREDGDRVVLDVVDHGSGVPAELKERIFQPFARLDKRSPGVGLGLAVAKGFAEAMGGTIVAIDTPGGGLTVRVTMPALMSGVPASLGADLCPGCW